jgi:hypothetical protein
MPDLSWEMFDLTFFEAIVILLLIFILVTLHRISRQISGVNRFLYYFRFGENDPSIGE